MIRKPSAWLVLVLLGAGLIAGCGSSSGSTTASSVTVPSSAAGVKTSSVAAPATSTTTIPSIPTTSSAGVAEALAICKLIVVREPTLSGGLKAKVEGICNKAAHGNLAAARAAGKEVCKEVIDASPIPGPAKAEALAACEHG